MSQTIRQTGGPWLIALLLAGAAQAQTFHYLYHLGDAPNDLTSVIQTSNSQYLATANFKGGASLMRLNANGDINLTRLYQEAAADPLRAAMVRQHGDYFAWTGDHRTSGGQAHDPVFVIVKFNLDFHKAFRIDFGAPADARALEIGPGPGGDLFVGGVVRPDSGQADPWIARFSPNGTLKWAKVFDCSQACDLRSLLPTSDGGVIGVGQATVDIHGFSTKPRMFAFKVKPTGDPEWAYAYHVDKVLLSNSQQWLADLSASGPTISVAGNVTDLCSNSLSPCATRPPSILTAKLDPLSGSLGSALAIFPPDGRPVLATTITRDQAHVTIGGTMRNLQGGGDEAFLLKGIPEDNILQGKLYGDGTGPAHSGIVDLARAANTNPQGPVFVTWQRKGALQRPAVVRTNALLSAGTPFQHCERPVTLKEARIKVSKQPLKIPPKDGKVKEIKLLVPEIHPTRSPCASVAAPG